MRPWPNIAPNSFTSPVESRIFMHQTDWCVLKIPPRLVLGFGASTDQYGIGVKMNIAGLSFPFLGMPLLQLMESCFSPSTGAENKVGKIPVFSKKGFISTSQH